MKIEGYSFGRIRIDGKTYSSDLILYPDHIQENWWRKQGHYLQVEDLAGIERSGCEVLVIGTGADGGMRVAPQVGGWLEGLWIRWEAHRTEKACQRYNALVEKGGRVAAALHLTC